MILLSEMVFAILVILIVGGIVITVSKDIQARLQMKDMVMNYTPEQIEMMNEIGKMDAGCQIQFCPMCGRKLSD